MSDNMITCPYCGGAVPADQTICPDCHEDLSALRHLELAHVIHYNEALALAREGNLERAAAKALVAAELQPSFTPAHVLLAKIYARQGRYAEAEATVGQAMALLPEDESVLALAGQIAQTRREVEARAAQARVDEVERVAAEARHVTAKRYLSVAQKDVAKAFGLGFGIAAFLAVIIGWLSGGHKKG